MFFAVIQDGHGVFGVGETEEEAIASSTRLGTPAQIRAALVNQDDALHGDIFLAGCTPELFNHVTNNGFESEIEFTEDGVADIDHAPRVYPVEEEQYAG
ncbi:hypothetical protein [Geomonas subterranea]|uniref:hypothetical protein n=1 Tax=Geomonas subterranea TaxID=2847989 RepID=UPI001CD4665D|nr:hypothetical protein [Geomonas fuzhouensis]